jgi:uroporphyrinogen decarboxylase
VNPRLKDAPLLAAARREPGPTPIWFMRQAGRALPEYRKLREGVAMLESCRDPDLTVEITLQPVRRFGVDAAILFSDIVVPLAAVGIDLDIVAGTGPVIAQPIRDQAAIEAIRPLEPDDVAYTTESVGRLVEELGSTPLIGFAGAPFTLASYLIEGGPSRSYVHTKALMYGRPDLWHELASRLAVIARTYLQVQVAAGASAIQLFDSWAGALSEADYREFVLPHSASVLAGVPDVPRIHFGVGSGELLKAMGEAGADVVGVDWRIPLDEAARRIGPGKAVQGNLDPTTLFAPWTVIERRVGEILERGRRTEGHIFNLGHGVMPETDPDVLTRVAELVHELG